MFISVSAQTTRSSLRAKMIAGAAVVGVLTAGAAAALVLPLRDHAAGEIVYISQRDRMFHPDTGTLRVGDTLRIVNDDGKIRHHAYVQTPHFSFDSGDQEPGQSADIVFPFAGTFHVLCGIHPKMHLDVVVETSPAQVAGTSASPSAAHSAE